MSKKEAINILKEMKETYEHDILYKSAGLTNPKVAALDKAIEAIEKMKDCKGNENESSEIL